MPASADFLQTPLQFLKGVGPRKAGDFARAGLNTVEDLLFRFPLRYEDRGHLQSIASLREGQTVSIAGKVITSGLRGTRRPGVRIFEALLRDASGTVRLSWFNSAYLKDQIHAGTEMVVYGTFERNQWTGLQITNPQFEVVDGDEPKRSTPAASSRSTSARDRSRRRCSGGSSPTRSRSCRRTCRIHCPTRYASAARARAARGARGRALSAARCVARSAQRVPHALAASPDPRGVLPVSGGLVAAASRSGCRAQGFTVKVDDRIRQAMRAVLPFHLTAGQRQALEGHRRGHAAWHR
jgi:ATP-dependent DNA helicase RecG